MKVSEKYQWRAKIAISDSSIMQIALQQRKAEEPKNFLGKCLSCFSELFARTASALAAQLSNGKWRNGERGTGNGNGNGLMHI